MYSLTTTVPPASEPVGLALAKRHLGIDHDDDDVWLYKAIRAARRETERYTGLRWITQTLQLKLADWPDSLDADDPDYEADGFIRIPVQPVQSVESVKYLDDDKDEQEIDVGDLDDTSLDSNPPVLGPGDPWPTVGDWRLPVRVEFVVGFGDSADDVPEDAVFAMLLCIANWFENRADQNVLIAKGIPPAAKALLDLQWTGSYT